MTTEFNPNLTTSAWKGIDLSTGLKEDSGIVYTPSADVTSYEAGMKSGESVVTMNSDESGTIEINTQYGSKTGQRLAAIYEYQRQSGKLQKGTFVTKNPNDTVAGRGIDAHIMQRTPITYGGNAENQGYKWVFKCTRMTTTPTGSSASSVSSEIDSLLSSI